MPSVSQLSYSHGASPQPLLGETIGDNLRRIAVTFPASEALVDVPTGRRWTYAQLDNDTDTVGLGLLALGINKGDRVGIWAPNCAEWVVLQYATAKIGAILVNINPAYRSHELAYVLKQSAIKLLVSAENFKASDYRAMIGEVSGDIGTLERVIYLGTPDWDKREPPPPAMPWPPGQPRWPSMTRSTSSTPAGPPDFPRARLSRITTS
jgi:fatty-acyl-CoA synthase